MKDSVENEELVLDTSGTECPIPVLKARKLASELNKNTIIKIIRYLINLKYFMSYSPQTILVVLF